ncbi:MAG TPA: polymer-forming cytoskeletal protein [Patescibacteria group bacterium]|nr:polymer-forming cytoskeletal protein [Patescibacteria group bacterium]
MFNRSDSPIPPRGNGREETMIARGVKVEGDFVSEGDVTVEGEVTGSVRVTQHLRVGQGAAIRADVSAGEAVVAGIVQGNLQISGTLELLETSRVDGDVTTKVLSVAPGARVNGRISMADGEVPVSKEQKISVG